MNVSHCLHACLSKVDKRVRREPDAFANPSQPAICRRQAESKAKQRRLLMRLQAGLLLVLTSQKALREIVQDEASCCLSVAPEASSAQRSINGPNRSLGFFNGIILQILSMHLSSA